MTREESIKRSDEIIYEMKRIIKDLEYEKQHFIDYDEDIGNNEENLIGVTNPSKEIFTLLFYKSCFLLTKTIIKK